MTQPVRAIMVNDHELVTTMSVQQLLDMCIPARAFKQGAKNDPVLQRTVTNLTEVHRMIQRSLTGAKLRNSRGPLRNYVEKQWINGSSPVTGTLPSFYLCYQEELHVDEIDDETIIVEPPAGKSALVMDGESRIEAFLNIIEDEEVDDATVSSLKSKQVVVQILHGLTAKLQAKFFADINGRAVPVNKVLTESRNYTDLYTAMAFRVFDKGGIFGDGGIETEKTTVSASSPAIMTILTARLMLAALVHGTKAARMAPGALPEVYTDDEGVLHDVDFEKLETIATSWFHQLFTILPMTMWKERDLVLRSPTTMVALATLGSLAYHGSEKKALEALTNLQSPAIDWTIGTKWLGISVKAGPPPADGEEQKYSLWSSRGVIVQAAQALGNPASPGYDRIRS